MAIDGWIKLGRKIKKAGIAKNLFISVLPFSRDECQEVLGSRQEDSHDLKERDMKTHGRLIPTPIRYHCFFF